MRNIIAIFALLFVLSYCFGCALLKKTHLGDSDEKRLDARGTLNVGVLIGKPPLIYKSALGELSGSEMELVRLFGERCGMKLVISEYDKQDLFIALRRGDIDVAIPAATEGEIAARFFAVCAAHGQTGQRLLANAAIAPFITELKQIDNGNVRVYAVSGSISAGFAEKYFKSADVAALETLDLCVEKVIKDNGCVCLTDETTANNLLEKYNNPRNNQLEGEKVTLPSSVDHVSPGDRLNQQGKAVIALVLGRLSNEKFAWAVRRSDHALKKELDAFIAEVKQKAASAFSVRMEYPLFEVGHPQSSDLQHVIFTAPSK